MVRINGGTFVMGSLVSEPQQKAKDGPRHRVTITSFYMGTYPVTVGEFRNFINAVGYRTEAEESGGGLVRTGAEESDESVQPVEIDEKISEHILTDRMWETKADANWQNPYFNQEDNHPVVLVSWFDAVQYCNWLSGEEGLAPAYTIMETNVKWNRNTNGYRLPTEAEWEYACRAGTTTPFNTGNNITTSQANYNGNYPYNNNPKGEYRGRTTPVGSFAPNAWGLCDMHGNVCEWCGDWYEYGVYMNSAQADPDGASLGPYRVIRGGGWYSRAQYLRSAYRYYFTPSHRNSYLGFRLVRP
jgi:formylglycine-generating enzyme required for sulfatase activity